MKKIIFLSLFFLIACTSSQLTMYRSAETNRNWQIEVKHNDALVHNFKVVINDSTVIDKDVNLFTGNAEAKGMYDNKEVRLLVNYSSGFLGIGKKYTALVFIEKELAAKFEF